jgi:hypothetical protein
MVRDREVGGSNPLSGYFSLLGFLLNVIYKELLTFHFIGNNVPRVTIKAESHEPLLPCILA